MSKEIIINSFSGSVYNNEKTDENLPGRSCYYYSVWGNLIWTLNTKNVQIKIILCCDSAWCPIVWSCMINKYKTYDDIKYN